MDRNSLTLLAVLALSVSNLFVGISTQNKLLILASAAISAGLAVFYIAREYFQMRTNTHEVMQESGKVRPVEATRARFPIWVFVVILFMILPALMWFVLTLPR